MCKPFRACVCVYVCIYLSANIFLPATIYGSRQEENKYRRGTEEESEGNAAPDSA